MNKKLSKKNRQIILNWLETSDGKLWLKIFKERMDDVFKGEIRKVENKFKRMESI